MADEIIDLRDLVPGDIVFVLAAGEYRMPGDLPNETVFTLYELLLEVADIEDVPAGSPRDVVEKGVAAIRRLDGQLQKILLSLLRVRHPDLETLPGGAVTSRMMTERLLKAIGFLTEAEDGEADPTRGGRRPARSGSSTTGSSRSSRTLGSPRSRGGGSASGKRRRGTTSADGG